MRHFTRRWSKEYTQERKMSQFPEPNEQPNDMQFNSFPPPDKEFEKREKVYLTNNKRRKGTKQPKRILRDWYVSTNTWYWAMQIIIYVFAAGLVADLVQVMNLSVVQDTVFEAFPGGKYETLKFNSLQWALLMLTNFKYLMPVVALLAILFRRNYAWSVIWVIVIILLWAVSFFVVIGFGRMYATANGQGQRTNFFTNELYCCAPDIFSNPGNKCPNVGPCACPSPPHPCPVIPTASSQLYARQDAVARFWVDFVYFLYHSFLVGYFVYRLATMPTLRQWQHIAMSKKRDDDEDKNDDIGSALPPTQQRQHRKLTAICTTSNGTNKGKGQGGKMTKDA